VPLPQVMFAVIELHVTLFRPGGIRDHLQAARPPSVISRPLSL